MAKVVETLYVGRDNTFSLQLLRKEEPIALLAITAYELHLSSGRSFIDQDRFIVKEDGIVEVNIGDLLTEDDVGSHTAYIVTFDPVNTCGVRWPNFKLKVRA